MGENRHSLSASESASPRTSGGGTRRRPRIGITIGDPAGIGPEVVLKAVAETAVREVCAPVIIGDAQMQEDGTIVVNLRRTADGINVSGIVRYPTSHPNYKEVLDHIGGMKPGEVKLVPAWGDPAPKKE